MKVLLPVEGAFDAKFIIDFISNYRWLRGTQFKLLHIIAESDADETGAVAASNDMLDGLMKTIQRHLPESVLEKEVIPGTPIFSIIQQSTDWEANMIVMGFRSGLSIHQYLAGSVSRGVTLQAPCSVVVIRPPSKADTHRDTADVEPVRRQA
jgi:nucleotide-binding universal stress UspA family protein